MSHGVRAAYSKGNWRAFDSLILELNMASGNNLESKCAFSMGKALIQTELKLKQFKWKENAVVLLLSHFLLMMTLF
jgi:hypothetical protein